MWINDQTAVDSTVPWRWFHKEDPDDDASDVHTSDDEQPAVVVDLAGPTGVEDGDVAAEDE